MSGRLEPPVGDPRRARFLQWIHWAEATFMPPIADILRQRFVLPESERSEAALASLRIRHLEPPCRNALTRSRLVVV